MSPTPKRGAGWVCPKCQTWNDTWRAKCMNGCNTRGPLAPPRDRRSS